LKSSLENDSALMKIMSEAIHDIQAFVTGFSRQTFISDKKTVAACAMLLQSLGENAGRLTKETQKKLNIEITELVGLRNRISHDYGSLDYDLVWDIIENDLLELQKTLKNLLNNSKK